MNLEITPMVLTYNEAPNLRRTLEKLTWAKEILVLDSFSTDETLDIARSYPQVRIVKRKFDTFAGQCNFGLQQIKTEWVLSMDADYVLSPEFIEEVQQLQNRAEIDGYRAGFRFCVFGRPLRATLYPARTVIYRRSKAHYQGDGHSHQVQVAGNVVELNGYINHDDRKSLAHWLWAQDRYTALEVTKLVSAKNEELRWPDRIRKKIILAPVLVFFYTLFVQGLIFDGWAGWFYVWQRTIAEMILSLHLTERLLTLRQK